MWHNNWVFEIQTSANQKQISALVRGAALNIFPEIYNNYLLFYYYIFISKQRHM